MQYIKAFKWLIAVIVIILVLTEVFQRSSLQNSEWVSGGWVWLLLAPCLLVCWMVAQVVALKDMKQLLIKKYIRKNNQKIAIPIIWYFVPLILVIIVIFAAVYLNSRNGYLSDGVLGGVEMLIVMAPTAVAGTKLYIKGVRKAL